MRTSLSLCSRYCDLHLTQHSRKSGPVCSTMRAHRLMQLAYKRGGSRLQSQLCHRLFAAFTETEQNLSCSDSLAVISEELGIMPREQVR